MSEAGTAAETAPAPAPSAAPTASAYGPTLPCRACGVPVLAGYVRCPSCGGSTRPAAAAALAGLAALSGLAALVFYGRDMITTQGAVLRPAFYALAALGTFVAAGSVFQGRRAGWIGIHVVWAAQVLVPLAYAMLLRRDVAATLVRDPLVKVPMVIGLAFAWLAPVRAYCSAPSNLMTMTRREISAFLHIPQAYVTGILTPFLFFMGLFFYGFILNAGSFQLEAGLERIAGNLSTFMIFCTPFLTMGLFAEEKRRGTLEVLVTSPVTDLEIVLSKFLGSLFFFFTILMLPSLVYVAFLAWVSNSPPDYGSIAAGYLGVFFMATVYFAIGVFVSSLTRNQIVAGIWTFDVFIVVWVTGFFADQVKSDFWKKILEHVNFVRYYESFGRGVVDSRAVIYFVSLTCLFLFLTVRSLESRRWA